MTDTRQSGQTDETATPPLVEALRETAEQTAEAYGDGEARPLGAYAVLISTYGTVGLGALTIAALRSRQQRLTAGDIALVAVATHKAARTLTKSAVTSPLRAPFTRYRGVSGPAELAEEVREHHGFHHALGELVTCPFCVSQWLATSFTVGLLVAPKPTRAIASVFAAVAGADFLQLAYAIAEQKAEGS